MVALRRFINKVINIIVSPSLTHLLMILLLCSFAFQSWNGFRTTESAAYKLVLVTKKQLDNPPTTQHPAQHYSLSHLSALQKVKPVNMVSYVDRMEPPRTSDILGARGLQFHEEIVDVAAQAPPPISSGWTFTGVLASDGSISSVKLTVEEGDLFTGSFAGYDPVNNTRKRPGRDWKNRKARKPQRASHGADIFNKTYPPCGEELRDLIPCLNTAQGHLYRRCPNVNRGPGSCVIPAPTYYSRQFKWPASKNQVRGPNVPNVPLLQQHRAAWMRPQGRASTIYLGDGDLRFPNGTNKYVHDLAVMIQDLRFGTEIRLVLDIGCGSGNLAAALETQGVLTLSIAGESAADNGVQLVIERGYPALVQSLGSLRLPYPSQAFDLIHCATCDVQLEENGALKLLEVDRILRAGGFFVWMYQSDIGAKWNAIEELTKNMCWRKVERWPRENFSLWRKPTNQTCYLRNTLSTPLHCNASVSPDASWNVPMQSCMLGFPPTGNVVAHPWPIRLNTPPRRLEQTPAAGIEAAKGEAYTADLNYWVYILAFYVVDLGPVRVREIHNVLDMNAGYGGFAAAVSMKTPPLQWWVLNVAPIDQPDRLGVIFDRGLLGVYHDWCESLDVYPRAFDMIHSSGLFSSTLSNISCTNFPTSLPMAQCQQLEYLHMSWPVLASSPKSYDKILIIGWSPVETQTRVARCAMSDIVQEMDRLLRPGGFAIIRDQEDVLLQIQLIATAMHWKATVEDTESGPMGKDKVLNCQKTFWQPRLGKNVKS